MRPGVAAFDLIGERQQALGSRLHPGRLRERVGSAGAQALHRLRIVEESIGDHREVARLPDGVIAPAHQGREVDLVRRHDHGAGQRGLECPQPITSGPSSAIPSRRMRDRARSRRVLRRAGVPGSCSSRRRSESPAGRAAMNAAARASAHTTRGSGRRRLRAAPCRGHRCRARGPAPAATPRSGRARCGRSPLPAASRRRRRRG